MGVGSSQGHVAAYFEVDVLGMEACIVVFLMISAALALLLRMVEVDGASSSYAVGRGYTV